MDMQGTMDLKKQLTDAYSQQCSQMLEHGDMQVDKLALCMDMQGTMDLKKQFTDGCSHSSVHTLFTDGDTW